MQNIFKLNEIANSFQLFAIIIYIIKNSIANTTAQQVTATLNKSAPSHATPIPATREATPETGDCVALTIDGNVITASVTYGT